MRHLTPSLPALLLAAALAAAGIARAQTSPQSSPPSSPPPAGSKAELDSVQRAVHVCAACHGEGGRSTQPLIPSLAGQMRDYTIRQLKDFRSQSRSETDIQAYMWGISALLTDDQIEGLADYYAAQPPAPRAARPRPRDAQLAAGQALYERGIESRGVLPCQQCHGAQAEGAAGFPRLAGLKAPYVLKQLQAFRTPLRPHGVVMKNETLSLKPQELKAVAAYLQTL